jgi:hypothetical protein
MRSMVMTRILIIFFFFFECAQALFGSIVFKHKKETVRLFSEHDLHELFEYEGYLVRKTSPLLPIGHFKIHTECDYEADSNVTTFCTDVNCIDLGRYGPFRRQGKFNGSFEYWYTTVTLTTCKNLQTENQKIILY